MNMVNYSRRRRILHLAIAVVVAAKLKKLQDRNRRLQRKLPICRTSSFLAARNMRGRYASDFEDLMMNRKLFQENFHMSPETFHSLYELVKPHLLPKRYVRPYDYISRKQKLAVVLEFLASGDLQRHIASCYRISKQHFGTIIDAVCDAIIKVLKPQMCELSKEAMVEIANGFNTKWFFPNCTGALDGKHVEIQAPKNAGSMFYNYKGFHSLVIMGIADANYKFTYLDIGAYGSEGDANVFHSSKFARDVIYDRLDFPPAAMVNGVKLPFFYVADDAFPLSKRIMKPYKPHRRNLTLTPEQRIFNYRLSRGRRCIENAFGIASAKWLCLKRTLLCGPDRAQNIIVTCCLLHNYLLKSSKNVYCSANFRRLSISSPYVDIHNC